jgi:hypothetical protein
LKLRCFDKILSVVRTLFPNTPRFLSLPFTTQ